MTPARYNSAIASMMPDPQMPVMPLVVAGFDSGPLMLNLKPGDWGGVGASACEPLMEWSDKKPELEVDMPVVAYGRDMPNSFAYMPHEEGLDLAAILLRAIERHDASDLD